MVRKRHGQLVGDGPDQAAVAARGSGRPGGIVRSDPETGGLAVASELGGAAVSGAVHAGAHVVRSPLRYSGEGGAQVLPIFWMPSGVNLPLLLPPPGRGWRLFHRLPTVVERIISKRGMC
ncbi:hypothetical protein GCM10022214_28770 [Actinomadura miaoliensis]|uniref:Uncharacterized protein n=1 Tax=Actinomadura miaoliensis TaxID=430685 RepID=A0ABP7VPJ8_9ACTN